MSNLNDAMQIFCVQTESEPRSELQSADSSVTAGDGTSSCSSSNLSFLPQLVRNIVQPSFPSEIETGDEQSNQTNPKTETKEEKLATTAAVLRYHGLRRQALKSLTNLNRRQAWRQGNRLLSFGSKQISFDKLPKKFVAHSRTVVPEGVLTFSRFEECNQSVQKYAFRRIVGAYVIDMVDNDETKQVQVDVYFGFSIYKCEGQVGSQQDDFDKEQNLHTAIARLAINPWKFSVTLTKDSEWMACTQVLQEVFNGTRALNGKLENIVKLSKGTLKQLGILDHVEFVMDQLQSSFQQVQDCEHVLIENLIRDVMYRTKVVKPKEEPSIKLRFKIKVPKACQQSSQVFPATTIENSSGQPNLVVLSDPQYQQFFKQQYPQLARLFERHCLLPLPGQNPKTDQ